MNGVWCLIVLVENQHRSAYFGIIQITIRLQTFESVFLNKDGKKYRFTRFTFFHCLFLVMRHNAAVPKQRCYSRTTKYHYMQRDANAGLYPRSKKPQNL